MAAFKVGQRVKLPQPDLLTEKQEGEVAQIAGDLAWVKMNDYVSVPCPLDELEPADPPADDEVTRLRAENARLRAALEPFVFDEDELFETHDFQDNELIFLRPKDGNDSVQNGWRKTVTFANVRRAADALKGGE